tara:strand:+ start:4221 stop:4487 length:267 start_codon:yes stop_codon:yes gene_type:complete
MRRQEKMIEILENKYPSLYIIKDGEDILMSGEDGTCDRNGIRLFDYYEGMRNCYIFGVVEHLHNWATRAGWFFEWQDSGTMMLRPYNE